VWYVEGGLSREKIEAGGKKRRKDHSPIEKKKNKTAHIKIHIQEGSKKKNRHRGMEGKLTVVTF